MPVKVSVVVPVYNPGRYIEPCIESLLNQTLPHDEYEVILVDDGSTDETPEYLDKLAVEHPQVRVFHIPNSGWPGKPRNVGVDEARGEYVQFVDQDDHMAPDALRQLYDMGRRNGSDIVIGKVASNFRGVPHGVFRVDRERCTIYDFGLIHSLTPHKMFRRAFLRDKGIKYAEGKRRLEDQLYMVQTYFPAKVVSILGSYTCYFYCKRDDGKNAGTTKLVPSGYYGNLREVLDVVVANTEPGAFRDGLLRRFYRGEMLGRISEPALPQYDDEYRTSLIDEIRKLAADFVTDGVHDGLPAVQRLRSTLLRQDKRAELVELARRCIDISGIVRLDDLEWRKGRIAVTLTTQLVYGSDRKPLLVRQGDRYYLDPSLYEGLLPPGSLFDVTDEISSFRAELNLRDRETAVEWACPGDFTADIEDVGPVGDIDGVACRVVMRGSGYLDPQMTKARGSLARGMWDVWVRVDGLGFAKRVRVGADRAAHVDGQCLPALLGRPARLTMPYFTDPGGNVTLDMNRRGKKLAAAVAAREIRRVAAPGQWFELELPVVAGPNTAPTPIELVVSSDSQPATYSLPAVLLPFRGRIYLRARLRLSDQTARNSLRNGTWEIAAQLDGQNSPAVPIGTVHISASGRLRLNSDFAWVNAPMARDVQAMHRRAEVSRLIRWLAGPVVRRLSPGAREKLRAKARSLGL
jgi:glycosyltransferase involved in cell wall biosynthesis